MWLSGDMSQATMAGAKALWQSVVGLFREQEGSQCPQERVRGKGLQRDSWRL